MAAFVSSSFAVVVSSFVSTPARSPAARAPPTRMSSAHWMDVLKFGGATPSFDVLERTKEYVAATADGGGLATDYHAEDYVFRGSIVGPITGVDVAATQKGFNLLGAYPDIDRAWRPSGLLRRAASLGPCCEPSGLRTSAPPRAQAVSMATPSTR